MISGITYYNIDDIIITCTIYGENIKIEDSYLVESDDKKLEIIDDLLKTFTWFKTHRTREDIFNEWKVHNHLYKLKFMINSTKDTDIELKQNIFVKFAYWLFAKFVPSNV